MCERWIRLFIAVAVLVTLFLPMTPMDDMPHWRWLGWASLEALSNGLTGMLVLWAVWAGPLLAIFVALAFRRSWAPRIVYWLYLLAAMGISLPLLVMKTDNARRFGYVVGSYLVYAAGVLEIVFLVLGRISRPKERGAQTGGGEGL